MVDGRLESINPPQDMMIIVIIPPQCSHDQNERQKIKQKNEKDKPLPCHRAVSSSFGMVWRESLPQLGHPFKPGCRHGCFTKTSELLAQTRVVEKKKRGKETITKKELIKTKT
jgi:hypothetical protein